MSHQRTIKKDEEDAEFEALKINKILGPVQCPKPLETPRLPHSSKYGLISIQPPIPHPQSPMPLPASSNGRRLFQSLRKPLKGVTFPRSDNEPREDCQPDVRPMFAATGNFLGGLQLIDARLLDAEHTAILANLTIAFRVPSWLIEASQ